MPPPVPRPLSLLPWLAFGVVAALLLLGLALLPQGVLWHPDEGAKLLQLENLHVGWSGPQAPITYPGRDLDPALAFVPFHPKQYRLDAAGAITLQWPLFLATLTAPFYALLGLAGLYFWPLLGALAACLLAWRLALKIGTPPQWAWLALPLLGLATPLGFYSWLFFEHTLATALVAGSALLLIGGSGTGDEGVSSRFDWRLAGSGLLLGLAIYLRSELYVLAGVEALLLSWRWQPWRIRRPSSPVPRPPALIPWALGLVLALIPLWGYYAIHGGGILPVHATWYFAGGEPVGGATGPRLPQLRYLAEVGWGFIPAFLVGPDNVGGPSVPPLLSLGFVLAALLAPVGVLLRWLGYKWGSPQLRGRAAWVIAVSLAGLALCSLAVLISPEPYANLHGFLLAAPFLALATLVLRPGIGRPAADLGLLCLLYVAGHVLVISALSGLGPISTYEWGQRYILPAYALAVPLAVRALPELWYGARRHLAQGFAFACAMLLVLVGAGFMLRGWMVLDSGKREIAGWQQTIAANHDPALLTDDWWLPLLLAPEFAQHRWYLISGPDGLQRWLSATGQKIETAASVTTDTDPVGDDLPVLERTIAPGGFTVTRHAVIAR